MSILVIGTDSIACSLEMLGSVQQEGKGKGGARPCLFSLF
jgi:hypothetical protein